MRTVHSDPKRTLSWLAGLGLLVGGASAALAAPPATAPAGASPGASGLTWVEAAAGGAGPAVVSEADAADTADNAGEGAGAPRVIRSEKIVVMDDGDAEHPSEHPIEFRAFGKPVPRGYLGVGLTDLTPELRAHFGVPQGAGVMVSQVEAGSPAEKAGVKVGDILSAIDGRPIASSFDLRMHVRAADDGAVSTLEVWRNGKVQTLSATLERRDRPEVDLAPLFIRKKDGDRMILRLDGGDLPKALAVPLSGAALPRVRVEALDGREALLEKRLKALEKRIQDLERQLRSTPLPSAH